jgi:hypothetical protein
MQSIDGVLSGRTMCVGAALIAASLVFGCTTPPKFKTETVRNVFVRVDTIYIYSFLDMREHELGKNFMREVQHDLDEQLSQHGVHTKQVWFNDTRQRFYVFETAQWAGTQRRDTKLIPVREVIAEKADDERAFGARYRLVMAPTNLDGTGVGYDTEVQYLLTDVKTGQVVWKATSKMDTVNWIKVDEQPVERAKMFVGGLIQEMMSAGLF